MQRLLLVTVAFPVPSIFSDAPLWITCVVCPAYMVLALLIGTFWITRRTVNALRWAIEERTPTREDQLNTFLAPWRVAKVHLILWGVGTGLFTTLYGLQDTTFIPRFLFTISFAGVVVATACYLLTEFALRPVAAQALEAGPPPRRLTAGIMGRLMIVWFLGSLPVIGIALLAVFAVSLQNLTETQFAVAVWILAIVALLVGFILMWIVSWLTATPVRVVRDRTQARRTGRSGLQRGGVRRHRARRVAARLQLDGRRTARARTGPRPVRQARRA